ncbi:hypothetical protein D3C80_1504080 [compost metagenome]
MTTGTCLLQDEILQVVQAQFGLRVRTRRPIRERSAERVALPLEVLLGGTKFYAGEQALRIGNTALRTDCGQVAYLPTSAAACRRNAALKSGKCLP